MAGLRLVNFALMALAEDMSANEELGLGEEAAFSRPVLYMSS